MADALVISLSIFFSAVTALACTRVGDGKPSRLVQAWGWMKTQRKDWG